MNVREVRMGMDECGEGLSRLRQLATMGQVAAGVAHDLNNLLAVINVNIRVLFDMAGDDVTGECARDILNACQRGSSLARALVDMSRRGSSVEPHADLSDVVRQTSLLLRRAVEGNVRLCVELSGQPCEVGLSAVEIEQVLLNLAFNARDAMPSGGELRVCTEWVAAPPARVDHGAPLAPGPYGVLRVADTGCGMDEATRARLGEPFFTTKGRGTGLGLASVREIVLAARGGIAVETAPSRGTTFHVYLPAVA